jgi:glutathione synthase/RimK-type ligase-like ATP-grasp enzyme
MKPIDLVILTDQNFLSSHNKNGELQTGFVEDNILKEAFENKGFKVLRLAWDDTTFDWATTKAIIFRSTWDYFYRFDEFFKWLKHVSSKTRLINSEALIKWNIDKRYLLELKNNGVHIAESYFISRNSDITLTELHNKLGWQETVLKPCISGTARHTYKLNERNIVEHESIFQELINKEAMMLQPFQYDIVHKGEVSMMLINGEFTHAVLKTAKSDDFRVQDEFGGSVSIYQPTNEEIDFAVKTIKACFELPLYARVDIFNDNNGKVALSELELIEPELWFRFHSESAQLLAEAIKLD